MVWWPARLARRIALSEKTLCGRPGGEAPSGAQTQKSGLGFPDKLAE
jgi:hypothetical protein